MANIFDYINWRGDLTFYVDKFNEVDNLILARLSYLPLDFLSKIEKNITIKEAYKIFSSLPKDSYRLLDKNDFEFFGKMANSARFSNLLLGNFVNKIDSEMDKQFSAITIYLPKSTAYISYRGTDNTIVGWKEDLYMSFSDVVPAQIDAIKYLNRISKEFKKLYVGGHSKGGNLAVYAASFTTDDIKDKIIKVYSNDGPGVQERVSKSEGYQNVIKKVRTFVPQSSVVGRLLVHEEKYKIVKSVQTGIMQHDLYSWQVIGNKFESLDELTDGSLIIDKSIKDWLKNIDIEKRKKVIDLIFGIIENTNAETLAELKANSFENSKTVWKAYKEMNEEDKEIINKTASSLINIMKDNFIQKKLSGKKFIKLGNRGKL